jgi:ATP-dependent 26S proteasome regulatory subunit
MCSQYCNELTFVFIRLLAKMDGVDGLGVPTLLIGLTNKPSLIDPAL